MNVELVIDIAITVSQFSLTAIYEFKLCTFTVTF